MQLQAQAFCAGLWLEQCRGLLQQRTRVERRRFQRHQPGFDTGKIQGVVHQPLQHIGGAARARDMRVRRRRHGLAGKQFKVAEHAAQRGTYFMADHCHEGGLGLVRGLGIVLGLFGMTPCIQQALLGFGLCGHIGHRADPDRPPLVARGGHDGLQVARWTVLVRGRRLEQLPVYLAVNALHQAADQCVQQVAGGVADQLLQCLVVQDQLPALLVEQAQADRRRFDQGAAQRFAFMHPCGFFQRRPQHAPVHQQQQRPQRGQQGGQGQPTAEQIGLLRRPDVGPAVEPQQRPVDALQGCGHHEGTAGRQCQQRRPGRWRGAQRRPGNRSVRSTAQNIVSLPVQHHPHSRAGLLQPLAQALKRFKRQPVDEGGAIAAQAHLGDQCILAGERIAAEVGAQPATVQLKLGVRTR